MYKCIPVAAAKKIAKMYDKNQVIIVTWDRSHGLTHITTYGKTKLECKEAAKGGSFIAEALGWPKHVGDKFRFNGCKRRKGEGDGPQVVARAESKD